MSNFVETLVSRQAELLKALVEHVEISLFSLLIAVLIALPVAILLTNNQRVAEFVLQITGILQTIPSLALLGLLIPLIGIGSGPAIVALVVYALFPILQSSYTGLIEIDDSLEEAAEAFGLSKMQKLIKLELPLALPMIIAGIRTATVMIIGTATLAALIGAGGLGTFILLGIDRNNINLILIGAISSALLAVMFNFGIRYLEKASGKKIAIVFGTLMLILGGTFFYSSIGQRQELTIAGKLGSEPDILINMYKELIEDQTDISVELKKNFGKTTFLYNALKSAEIDLYPEFSGTILESFIKKEVTYSNNPKEVYELARDEIQAQDNFVFLDPMAYQNTYAVAVKRTFAEEYNLTSISDLKKVQNQLTAGFTLEFIDRQDGLKGLESLYGLKLTVKSMEPALRYQAIENGDVNVIDAYSTDSELKQYDLQILQDDQELFPPYQGAPLLRQETLAKYPELTAILNQLAGKIAEEEMSEMNYDVNVNGEAPSKVAHDYLVKHQLLSK